MDLRCEYKKFPLPMPNLAMHRKPNLEVEIHPLITLTYPFVYEFLPVWANTCLQKDAFFHNYRLCSNHQICHFLAQVKTDADKQQRGPGEYPGTPWRDQAPSWLPLRWSLTHLSHPFCTYRWPPSLTGSQSSAHLMFWKHTPQPRLGWQAHSCTNFIN